MIYLFSGGTRTLSGLAIAHPDLVGFLVTPRNQSRIATANKALGAPWAVDNGAYAGFDAGAFAALLRRASGRPGCLFCVVPDVVADARATLALFEAWRDRIAALNFPIALAGQDGAESLVLPWDRADALFLGGSTRWKLSNAAADLSAEARRLGLWLHMGRVNSLRRLRCAYDLGCDSVDGSGPTRFGDKYTRNFIRWLRLLHAQPTLF